MISSELCSTLNGNQHSLVTTGTSSEPLSFIDQFVELYKLTTGDYNYTFQGNTTPPFTTNVGSTISIYFSKTPESHTFHTNSIALGDEAKIVFDLFTGNVSIEFFSNAGIIPPTFNVSWASFTGTTFIQFNDDGGGTQYVLGKDITNKLFDVTYNNFEVTIKLYELFTVDNIVSRNFTFNPFYMIANVPASYGSFFSNFINFDVANQYYVYTLDGVASESYITSPVTSDPIVEPITGSPLTFTGYTAGFKNNYIREGEEENVPGSKTTDVFVSTLDSVPLIDPSTENYFSSTSTTQELIDVALTGSLYPTTMESIIRKTFSLLKRSSLLFGITSFSGCVNECAYTLRITGNTDEDEC